MDAVGEAYRAKDPLGAWHVALKVLCRWRLCVQGRGQADEVIPKQWWFASPPPKQSN